MQVCRIVLRLALSRAVWRPAAARAAFGCVVFGLRAFLCPVACSSPFLVFFHAKPAFFCFVRVRWSLLASFFRQGCADRGSIGVESLPRRPGFSFLRSASSAYLSHLWDFSGVLDA